MEPILARRRADFWTSLVLLVVAAAMLGGALQFPLRGTYAGVRNVWYVSPALFPLIVATGLGVLAVALMLGAVRAGAVRVAFAPASGTGRGDVVLIGALIAAFVVGFVPRIDFVVAGGLFLLAFTTAFHVAQLAVARVTLLAFFGTAAAVSGLALLGLTPASRSTSALVLDAVVLAVLAGAIVQAWRAADATGRRPLRQCIAVALASPLVLGAVFKLFLLVPLPREGLVAVGLDTARYALRAAF